MKQKILTLAIAALAMTGFQAMAKGPRGPKAPCNTPCDTTVCTSAPCAPGAVCTTDIVVGPDFFEGITLTEAQQAQLQGIQQNRDSLRRESAKARREERASRRDDRMKADSARIAARQAETRAYLGQIKEVLSPDQYVTFLENFYVNAPQGPRKGVAPGRPGKGMKPGKATKGDFAKGRLDGKREKVMRRDDRRVDKAEFRKDYKKAKSDVTPRRFKTEKTGR